ncbi:MAG: KH domain-containing protein [Candidatus Hodarchaeaceae archaeon]|nr:KH domain-containing protein [Candidatus Hodarchaeaceae archaeon]
MYARLPKERIGVAVGPEGQTKQEIERRTGTKLTIDSETGEVRIESTTENPLGVLKARDVINAIARGFSSERALRLLKDDQLFEIIDIRDFAGDSDRALVRLKGRVIGEQGKTRQILEQTTGTHISVYGKTIALIGTAEQLAVVREALNMLLVGAKHSTVYRFLERKRGKSRATLIR